MLLRQEGDGERAGEQRQPVTCTCRGYADEPTCAVHGVGKPASAPDARADWSPAPNASPNPDRGDDPADIAWAREFIGRIEGMYEEWMGEGPAPSLSVDYEALTARLRLRTERAARSSCAGDDLLTSRLDGIDRVLDSVMNDEIPDSVAYSRIRVLVADARAAARFTRADTKGGT